MKKFSAIFAVSLLILNVSIFPIFAQKTQICARTGEVLSASGKNEKSICLVTHKLTQKDATTFCAKNEMKLYNPATSTAAATKLSDFFKAIFKGSSQMTAIIAGKGAACQIVDGAGKISPAKCDIVSQFICEFQYSSSVLLPRPGECGAISMSRIVGGTKAGLREFPWLAHVQLKFLDDGTKKYRCGGALISKRYVITSAWCCTGTTVCSAVRLSEWDESTGVDCIGSDCNEAAYDVEVEEQIIHPKYNKKTRYNDISVLRLKKDVKFTDFVKPLCLPVDEALRKFNLTAQTMTVAGWGKTTAASGSSYSDVLMKVNLDGLSNQKCNATYSTIIESQLCAGGVKGFDACAGDIGGPLMRQNTNAVPPYWYATGVVSTGKACAGANISTIFTRVTEYVNWIQSVIKA